jgi:hypothetical protein
MSIRQYLEKESYDYHKMECDSTLNGTSQRIACVKADIYDQAIIVWEEKDEDYYDLESFCEEEIERYENVNKSFKNSDAMLAAEFRLEALRDIQKALMDKVVNSDLGTVLFL